MKHLIKYGKGLIMMNDKTDSSQFPLTTRKHLNARNVENRKENEARKVGLEEVNDWIKVRETTKCK